VKFQHSNKKIYQKLGYSIDQEGILTRFLREGNAWKSHLEHTKQWIRDAYAHKEYSSIAIFGSGWLLDVPIDDIIRDFKEVYLFDIIHPLQITHKYKKYPHVHFIEADVTGGVAKKIYDRITAKSHVRKQSLPQLTQTQFSYDIPFDLLVSLNIVNQLDILLLEALEKHETVSEEEKQDFRYCIQKNHMHLLEQYNYCLISDWEKLVTHTKTRHTHSEPLVFVEPPAHTHHSEWLWNFDSQGLYEENSKIDFRVRAFRS